MFKKVLFTVLLFCPSVVWGQLLSVTATLTDPDSVVWVNGTCTVQLYSPNGTAFFGTTVVPAGPQACAINGSGVLSTSIYNTSTITPLGAQYRFNISSATSAPGSSFLTPVTAANMTSTLSAQLVAPRFSAAIAYAYGYADVEAIATAPGGQYYKTTTTAGQRIWSGSAWTSGGGGGGSGCTAVGAAGVFQTATGTGGACQASSITENTTEIDSTKSIAAQADGAGNGIFYADGGSGGAAAFELLPAGENLIAFIAFSSGGGNAGVWGMLDSATNVYTWASNQVDDFCFAAPGASVNTASCGTSPAKILHTGAATFTSVVTGTLPVPGVDTATPVVSGVACIKSQGPPISLGVCTSVVGAGGACTCS